MRIPANRTLSYLSQSRNTVSVACGCRTYRKTGDLSDQDQCVQGVRNRRRPGDGVRRLPNDSRGSNGEDRWIEHRIPDRGSCRRRLPEIQEGGDQGNGWNFGDWWRIQEI